MSNGIYKSYSLLHLDFDKKKIKHYITIKQSHYNQTREKIRQKI